MKKFQQYLVAFALVIGIGVMASLPAQPAAAINIFNNGTCDGANKSNPVCQASKKDTSNKAQSMARTVINTILYVLGILSVVMIVFAGVRYTISAGDASKVKAAKDTLMYAIIGLVVALLAFSIVNFVLTRF